MNEIKIIDLSMYSAEFRKGFDAASVSMAVRESMFISNNAIKNNPIFVKIHKDSASVCQGICSENMIKSELVFSLPIKIDFAIEEDEVWLKIFAKTNLKK